MYLEVFADNPFASNCWLLGLEDGDQAVVIDPGFEPRRVLALLERSGRRPVAALCTHGHFDHVGAAAEVCGDDVACYIHGEDELAFVDGTAWGSGFPVQAARPSVLRTVSDGDRLHLGGMEFEVLHTPGHTPGSSSFVLGDLFFGGDLVFRGGIGRYDFPHSSAEAMFASLRRFLALPDDVRVHPGHGETTTVALERASNPFLLQLV